MAVLQSTNVQGTLCVNGVAVGGGKDFKYCCFTASTTWTPSQDLVDGDGAIEALVVGGGGGAGAVSVCLQVNQNSYCIQCLKGAGGGGATAEGNKLVKIDSTDACTVTIGAGGVGACMGQSYGNVCQNAGVGGCSSFAGIQVSGGGGGANLKSCPNQGGRCNAQCHCVTSWSSGKSLNGGCFMYQALGGTNYYKTPVPLNTQFPGGCDYVGLRRDLASTKDQCRCASQFQTTWDIYDTICSNAAFPGDNCTIMARYPLGFDGADTSGKKYNGEHFGSGGNSQDMGGASAQAPGTSSADISCCYVEVNNATQCAATDCTTTKWYIGDGKYGGGAPGVVGATSRNATGASQVGYSSFEGQDGIVVLKWSE